MLCGKVVPVVDGLKAELGKQMDFVVTPNTEGDAPERIVRYGLDVHGMVVIDQDDKVLWKESGHKQQAAVVKAELVKLLAK